MAPFWKTGANSLESRDRFKIRRRPSESARTRGADFRPSTRTIASTGEKCSRWKMFNVARRYFTRRISRTPIPGNRVKHSPKTSAHDDRCDNRWRENSHRKRDRSVPYRETDPLQCLIGWKRMLRTVLRITFCRLCTFIRMPLEE